MDDSDDIEIIEVVGLDQELDPPAAPATEVEESAEVDEIVLDLDEDPEVPIQPSTTGAASQPISDDERLLRLQADYDNFKRRVERDRAEHRRLSTADLISRLLPVLDNFERAVSVSASNGDDSRFRDGVILIFKQLLEELRREGLGAVDTVGESFDPRVHDAVATIVSTDHPSNTIVEELQRGYVLQDRLLRPALVRVCLSPEDVAQNNEHEGL